MIGEKPGGYWPIGYTLKEVNKDLEEKRKKLDRGRNIFSSKQDVKENVNYLIKQKK